MSADAGADPFGPEISDLIIDYDPSTLARRPVRKDEVIARLEREGRATPLGIARGLPATDGVLDPAAMDGILLRSHLELQRLHEEFAVGESMLTLLRPIVALARAQLGGGRLRVVDLGCGLGFMVRWLAAGRRLGDDVELVGADYNQTLVRAAQALANAEQLPCRFVAANAFRLEQPAHVFISTGVVHHFRGADLVRLFAEHERSPAIAFLHLDIRPSWIAPIGSFLFHQARMREPLARWDGYFSAARAHPAPVLVDAARRGAPAFALGTLDAAFTLHTLVRIFQAVVGVRASQDDLRATYAPLGRRFASAR